MITELYYQALSKIEEYKQKINEIEDKEIYVIAQVDKYHGTVMNAWYVDTEEEAKKICECLTSNDAYCKLGFEYSYAKIKKIKEI